MKRQSLFSRCQPLPRTAERQLNPKRGGDKNVDFPSLDFLKVARGNFGPLGQFILSQFFAHPFPAHIGTEDLDSPPFFLGNCHGILHRFLMFEMNDTYIVKTILNLTCLWKMRC